MRRNLSRQLPLLSLVLLFVTAPALHASFIVNYVDTAGVGFYDATYGAGRRAAFEQATAQWNTWLGSSDAVPIRIETSWAALGAGVLGQSMSTNVIRRDFSGASVANTWYGDALADRLHGSDLGSGAWDMKLTFNTDFTVWNYDYSLSDGAFPGLYDFTSVAMHEVGHGMGLWSTFNSTGAWGYATGYPSIYDRFLEYQDGTDLIATNPAPDVTMNSGGGGAADNGVFWSGTGATAANGGNRVQIYAPATWASGSSFSHISNTAFPGYLMTYSIGTNDERRTIDAITSGMLTDLGWTRETAAHTPEPTSLLLFGAGIGPVVVWRRRKRAERAAA